MAFQSPGVQLASGRLIENIFSLTYTDALDGKIRTALTPLPGLITNGIGEQGAAALNVATDAGVRYVISVIESLRDWQDAGKTPQEIHQPGVGLWVRKLASGWEMVYAELALGIQFDLSLSPSSIEATFFADWYAAMRSKLATGRKFRAGQASFSISGSSGGYSRVDYGDDVLISGLGRIGGGGAVSAPPFWTRHVLSREVIP